MNRRTPESAGLPSRAVIDFLDYIEECGYALHSFILMKDGDIISEGYYSPFNKDRKHRIYSCSKSIVSLAVGGLVGEGLVSLDAPLVSYFPEITECPEILGAVTVEDALKMTLPMSESPYNERVAGDPDHITTADSWIASFFSGKALSDKPRGHLFRYNSHASYILGALVERVAGMQFYEYLRPVLRKIGVSEDYECVKSPEGIDWGSSGLCLRLEDFARIANLMMNRGEWQGEQLLPREYMERATSKQIDTRYTGGGSANQYGYGYQIWIEPLGFGMHGMLGQVAFCFPERGFVFVANSCEPEYRDVIYRGARELYKAIADTPLSESPDTAILSERLSGLRYNQIFGTEDSPSSGELFGQSFEIADNPSGITELSLSRDGDVGRLELIKRGERKRLDFGIGKMLETTFPETKYYSDVFTVPSGRELRALTTGYFTSEHRLIISVEIADKTLGQMSIVIERTDRGIAVMMTKVAEAILGEYQGMLIGKRKEK